MYEGYNENMPKPSLSFVDRFFGSEEKYNTLLQKAKKNLRQKNREISAENIIQLFSQLPDMSRMTPIEKADMREKIAESIISDKQHAQMMKDARMLESEREGELDTMQPSKWQAKLNEKLLRDDHDIKAKNE